MSTDILKRDDITSIMNSSANIGFWVMLFSVIVDWCHLSLCITGHPEGDIHVPCCYANVLRYVCCGI